MVPLAVTVTSALALRPATAVSVAVTVTVGSVGTRSGAVKRPSSETVPVAADPPAVPSTDQSTPFGMGLAEKSTVSPTPSVKGPVGLSSSASSGGGAHAARTRANAARPRRPLRWA